MCSEETYVADDTFLFSYFIDLAAHQRADDQLVCVYCFLPPRFLLQYVARASVLSSSEGWR